jgi:ABC-type transporter Mla maintaining outer membrane lipid asymmetry ATPase subunit MlaF
VSDPSSPETLPPVLEVADVEKRYQALRPLRLRSLIVRAAERVAVVGLDAGAAEVLVNLVTGAGLPDRGTVRVLGQATSDIVGGDEWLASLDRFGILSPRGVLLEAATIAQNLAVPFTLQIDPMPPEIASRVAELAAACGIVASGGKDADAWLMRLAGEVPPEIRSRAHLARAIALEPRLVLLEHPTAELSEATRGPFAADVVRVTDARKLATLVITQDQPFAHAVAHRVLKLDPASGVLKPLKRGWFT